MGSRGLLLTVLVLVATPGASPRAAPAKAVTITDLLRLERETLQRILRERAELRRVRVGRRVAQGELRRLESVHREISRRRKGVVKVRAGQDAQLRRRLRALVRLVRRSARRPLLDPRRARATADGRSAMVRILKRDLGEIKRLRAEEQRLTQALADVVRRRREAVAVLSDLDRRRDALQAQAASCRQELAGLRHRRQTHRGQANEWNTEAYRIEREIVALHQRIRREVPSFAKQRGALVRPVPGLIVTWFGERHVTGTKATEESRGVEISALPAWKVRAPADGTVRYAGAVPAFGNVVVIDHSEGYLSVVGRLGPLLVKVGDPVRGGRSIATLPARRDVRGLKVYFELRRAGRAFDPIPWIQGGLAERHRRGPAGGKPTKGPRDEAVVERE